MVKYEVTEKRNKLKSSKQELDDVFFFLRFHQRNAEKQEAYSLRCPNMELRITFELCLKLKKVLSTLYKVSMWKVKALPLCFGAARCVKVGDDANPVK